MTVFTINQAFFAYEASRCRLPSVKKKGEYQKFKNLSEISDQFDVFFLDAFGVLNIGDRPIAGVPERVAMLQKQEKKVIVVSNAAGSPQQIMVDRFRSFGYKFESDDIITSRLAMLKGLSGLSGIEFGIMANEDYGKEGLEALKIKFLADDPGLYDSVQAFILLASNSWTENRQLLLEASLKKIPRPIYVGNPDIIAPHQDFISLEPGHFAHRIADSTGISPCFFGKPFLNIYELAFARLGGRVSRDRILMVGDSLHTDILGAQNAGIKSALISGFGFFSKGGFEQGIQKSQIFPDFILEQP